ncbi:hypothetical protein RvY_06534 [Ramazzottius varieornatus]|uniref:Histone deacetylase domain-containing protein n=1 Tax=Ramazzottius varieornatus TaxID=947166 RepID=A0A1D1V7L8_RAMVA|nr:hypothetical protein RvY_06534 [Ramazzottius varieornatus]
MHELHVSRFNVGKEDGPVFDGIYELCQPYTTGSIEAAIKLNKKETDIAISWADGLHHAKNHDHRDHCGTSVWRRLIKLNGDRLGCFHLTVEGHDIREQANDTINLAEGGEPSGDRDQKTDGNCLVCQSSPKEEAAGRLR